MKKTYELAVAVLLLGSVAMPGAGQASVEYRGTVLPLAAGYTKAYAAAINDAGDIAGTMWTATGESRAVCWRHDGSITVFYEAGGSATAINNLGQVVGTVPDSYPGGTTGMLWNPDGTRRSLPGLYSANDVYPYAISDQGVAVGHSRRNYSTPNAIYWAYGIPTSLGLGTAVDINSSSEILTNNTDNTCSLFTVGGAVSFHGPSGCTQFYACSLNDSSEAFGWYVDSTGPRVPYIWSKATGIRVLPLAPGVRGPVMLGGMNNNRWAVAMVADVNGICSAVVWQGDGSMVGLPGVAGATFTAPYGINNNNSIVGIAGDNAILWTPVPEPSGLLAFACGTSGLGVVVWCRRRHV